MSYQKLPWTPKEPQQIILQYRLEGPPEIGWFNWIQLVRLTHQKQKQQAKQRPNARYASCKTTILRWNIHSIRNFSTVSRLAKIGAARKNSQKQTFVVRVSTYAVGSVSLTDASKKWVQRDDYAMQDAWDLHRSEKSQLELYV